MSSETEKYLHLTTKYLQQRPVVEIGSGGHPVVAWAIQVELGREEMIRYRNGEIPPDNIEIHDSKAAFSLPFKNGTLAAIYSSHTAEDWNLDQRKMALREWTRCVKQSGFIVILVPEVSRWKAYLERGGIPNCSHFQECQVGEWSELVRGMKLPLEVVEDRLTDLSPEDYSILVVLRRI